MSTQKKITRTAQRKLTAEYILDIATDTVYDTVAGAVISPLLTASLNGAKVAAIAMPVGAVVESGRVDVLTAFDHAGATTAAIGDTLSAARYLSATSIKSTGITALVPTEYIGIGNPILVTFAAASTNGTVGKFRLVIDYSISGKADEVTHYVAN